MARIFVNYQKPISFIDKDVQILAEHHVVRVMKHPSIGSLLFNFPVFIKNVYWCDMTYSWFGKLHAFFAVLFSRIFNKKSVVVAGGDDVACVPEIKYGMFSFWWKKWCPLFVFRHADLVIPVSKFNKIETQHNAETDTRRLRMIYHGFSESKFKKKKNIETEREKKGQR